MTIGTTNTTGSGAAIASGIFVAAVTGWEMYRCHRKGATRQSHRWGPRGITSQWVTRTRNPKLYRRNMVLLGFFCLFGIVIAVGGAIFPDIIH
jgi:hypothetical protein